jgi:hypothetical protein
MDFPTESLLAKIPAQDSDTLSLKMRNGFCRFSSGLVSVPLKPVDPA